MNRPSGLFSLKTPQNKALALSVLARARLYVILTSHLCKRPVMETARLALEGGADIIQLREKEMPDKDFLQLAIKLRELTTRMGRLFIVNDRPRIACESGADGLHLGQEDTPIAEASALVGKDMLIGLSTHNLEQARLAFKQGANYLGIGPIFPTSTKPIKTDESPIGTEILRLLKNFPIPYFAIGGINLANLDKIIVADTARVAACSAVINQEDVLNAAYLLSSRLRGPSPIAADS